MARTPFLEKTGSIRTLGAFFVVLCLFFVWITYAVFNKTFVSSVPVTLTGSTAGASLPSNADVKLRGMIVGEVRQIDTTDNGVRMKLAIKPSAINEIPRDVSAQIVPKTLFGEKYIDLVPSDNPTGAKLQAGDTISSAVVPIEVETVLNDLYPLLEAVQPAELSYTLSAVSTALDGRGEQLGKTLVAANDYLKQINPDVPELVNDINKLGTVSDGYAAAMPELGRLLKNLVVTGDTIVAKRAQLAAFFAEGTNLSNTTADFLSQNGDNIVTLAHETRPVVEILSDYSKVFPCVLRAVTDLTPKLNSAFRGSTLHIQLTVLGNQPTGYEKNESGTVPSKKTIDAQPLAAPSCHTLSDPNNPKSLPYSHSPDGKPYSHDNVAPPPPYRVYQLLGLDPGNNHNKFYNRTAAADGALIDMVQPSLDGIDSAAQRDQINALLAASLGVRQSDLPDVGSLLVSPMIRGMEVSTRETR